MAAMLAEKLSSRCDVDRNFERWGEMRELVPCIEAMLQSKVLRGRNGAGSFTTGPRGTMRE